MAQRTPKHDYLDDSVMEYVQMLPDLAVTLHQAVPHDHHGFPAADGLSIGRAATEVIARLSEKDVVRRERDDTDRRIVFVSLAGRADGNADTALTEWREDVEATLASYPEIDPATLVAFLRALVLRLKIAAAT
ncbi:MAG TPA: hypothetical protein VFH61_07165 [Thermoleophilia bacterium]|nr:hypothetical protein [Thermoleophilia bacterium]